MLNVDHSKTKVLLIGVSNYSDESITNIPNVKVNIALLTKSLVDSSRIGIPRENILISLNENRTQILKKLKRVVTETATKAYTLIIYFSGHGIMSSENHRLHFATPDIAPDDLIDGIDINEFKEQIKNSIAGRKILIMDCCHSGAGIGAMGIKSSFIQAAINTLEGTYVLASAPEDESALFPEDDPDSPTHFTGKLLEIINFGLEIEEEYCSFKDIYFKIKADFSQLNFPLPQQSSYNSADELYFSKNPYFLKKDSLKKVNKKNVIVAEVSQKKDKSKLEAKNQILSYYEIGRKAIDENKFQEAIEVFAKAIELNPNNDYFDKFISNADIFNNRAIAKTHLKDYTGAIDDYRRAIKISPDQAYFSNLISALQNFEKYDLAIEECLSAGKLYPNDFFSYLILAGDCYCSLKNYEKALEIFVKVNKFKPNEILFKKAGNCYTGLKEYKLAIIEYDQAILLNPTREINYCFRASCFYSLGEYEKALRDCDKAITLDIRSQYGHAIKGDCYKAQKRYVDAIQAYTTAIKWNSKSDHNFYERGCCLLLLNKHKEAREDFKKALKINPNNEAAIERLKIRWG